MVVEKYTDQPTGLMLETSNGGGMFKEVRLHPSVTVREENMVEKAIELHQEANKLCFIANSCNFPIHHFPETKILS